MRACLRRHLYQTLSVSFLLTAGLGGQVPQPSLPHAGLPGLKTASTEQYRNHLQALQQLVRDCIQRADACDTAQVGDLDDFVRADAGAPYIERYGWLRDLLVDRNDPEHKRRTDLLPHAAQRLAEQVAELDSPVAAAPLTTQQKSARTAVLAQREFRTTQDYSLTERLAAWVSNLLSKLFGGFSTLGRMAPWLGTALQWGALLLTAVLLLVWVYRALDRQRIALGKLHTDSAANAAQAESRAWAAMAQQHAERGAWRDAVHALYWASIVALEDRRTLRRSGTRTPREALRLIDPASHLREPLHAQTGEFERIWYGQQPAAQDDYQSALRNYESLRQRNAKAVAV
ncbi:MAG: DUF4129 domain-containing protein [Janthinobacterium lividum]